MSRVLFGRLRRMSPRAMLAFGGIAAVAIGTVATTDTLAASTDTATAQVPQIASENFFPAPLPAGNPSCSESGSAGFHKATVSWPSVGAGYKYRLTLWNEAATSVSSWGSWYQTGTSWTLDVNYNLAWANYTLTVQTVNVSSGQTDTTRETSSGWVMHKVGSNNQRNATCQGGAGRKANATWEDASTWSPASPLARGKSTMGKVLPLKAPQSTETSTVPSTSATSSANPSAEPEKGTETPSETAVPSTTTTEAPSTTETPTTTTNKAPATSESTADKAKITIGIGLAANEKVLLVYRDGEEVCHTPLAEGDQPSMNGGTVVIQNGDTVKKVNTTTCAVS